MKELLQLGLMIGGWSLVALSIASFWIPKALGWREKPPGMDPASFQNRREGLSWKSDVKLGTLLMLVGTLGAWLVWAMEWRQILIMFLPMSLGFHFGALRVLFHAPRHPDFAGKNLGTTFWENPSPPRRDPTAGIAVPSGFSKRGDQSLPWDF